MEKANVSRDAQPVEHGNEVAQEAAIHPGSVLAEKMGFINQHKVALLDAVRLGVDGLNASEQDLRSHVAAVQAGAVNAGWRIRPGAQHRRVILRD